MKNKQAIEDIYSEAVQCILSDHHGIYIPQAFAQEYYEELMKQFKEDDVEILLYGPDHEHYWEVWDCILNDFEFENGDCLYQNGSLYAVDWVAIHKWELERELETGQEFIWD